MAHTLPPELWSKIILLLPTSSLPALALTSRIMLTHTQPHIFASLTLTLPTSSSFSYTPDSFSSPFSHTSSPSPSSSYNSSSSHSSHSPSSSGNPFSTLHRLKSLHDPAFAGLAWRGGVWGVPSALDSVRAFTVRDWRDGGGVGAEEGWRAYDMYRAPVGVVNNYNTGMDGAGMNAGIEGEDWRDYDHVDGDEDTKSASNIHILKAHVAAYALSTLTLTLVSFPALTSLTLSFARNPVFYDLPYCTARCTSHRTSSKATNKTPPTLDPTFKSWLHARLTYHKLRHLEIRGVRNIGLQLSAALLGAEEVCVAECSFESVERYRWVEGVERCRWVESVERYRSVENVERYAERSARDMETKKNALDLKMYRAFAKSSSRLRELKFESPHSIPPNSSTSTLAAHWDLLGLNTNFNSPIRSLGVRIPSYDPHSLSCGAALVQLLSSSLSSSALHTSNFSSLPTSHLSPTPPPTPKPALRTLTIHTTPLRLSHLSFQPPPDPRLASSRVVFYPAATRMGYGHGEGEGNGMCYIKTLEGMNGWGDTEGGWNAPEWRDALLIMKQSASPPPSASLSLGSSLSYSSSHGSRSRIDEKGTRTLTYDTDDDGDLDWDAPALWFQRYMRDAGYLPGAGSLCASGPAGFACAPLRKLSFHVSFWLTSDSASSYPSSSSSKTSISAHSKTSISAHTNGELGFVLSYLSALSRDATAAAALEEVDVVVKVGAGDCIENLNIWTGWARHPSSVHSLYTSSNSSPYSSHSSHLSSSPLLASPALLALSALLTAPAFTHLAALRVVLTSRLGCQWGVRGVREVVAGVVGGVREGMRGSAGLGGGVGVGAGGGGCMSGGGAGGMDVDVEFRLI